MLHHLGGSLASPKYFGASVFASLFEFGDSGVAFFFVLSGFIITWVHAKDFGHPGRLASYVRKRTARIYPTYIIVFCLAYAALLISPATRESAQLDFVTLVKSLALVPQDAKVVGGTGAPVLIVAWTLQYEICFYALVGLGIVNRLLGVGILLVLAGNWVASHLTPCRFPLSFFGDNLFLLFGLGMLIARLARGSLELHRPTMIARVAAAAFLGFALLETVLGHESFTIDRRLVYGALSGVLILALVRAEAAGKLRIRGWIPLLGDASYALYLIHFPLIVTLAKLLRSIGLNGLPGALMAFVLIFITCQLAALAFHLVVERPILAALSGSYQHRGTRMLDRETPGVGSGSETLKNIGAGI